MRDLCRTEPSDPVDVLRKLVLATRLLQLVLGHMPLAFSEYSILLLGRTVALRGERKEEALI